MDSLNELNIMGSKIIEAFQFGGFYSKVLDFYTFGINGYKNIILAFEKSDESLRKLIERKFILLEDICSRFNEVSKF